MQSSTNWPIAAANGCAAPARRATSSSPAASAWPATWPSSRSSAAAPTATGRRSRRRFNDAIADIDELEEPDVRRRQPSSPTLDRQFLVERQLISRELAEANGARGVAIDPQETFSLMINEEDHLRMQVMHSGLDLEPAWEQINRDGRPARRAQSNYAFHERLGYLTACPTNVGTGMRVSVMLHLPALVITQQIEKVFRSLQKMGLAVRGLYGEGSQAMGDFYQISNQITLGRSEIDLVKQVGEVDSRASSTTSGRPARSWSRRAARTCTTASAGPTAFSARPRRSPAKRRCTCCRACGWASIWG